MFAMVMPANGEPAFVCPAFEEATMFRVARMFERATDFHEQRPPLHAEAAA